MTEKEWTLTDRTHLLYATIAQISATFVSILGGFLLTYALGRIAEQRRLERKFILRDDLIAGADEKLKMHERSKSKTEEKMSRANNEITIRLWRCNISQVEARTMRDELNEKFRSELAVDDARIAKLRSTIDRASEEHSEIVAMLQIKASQIKIAATGVVLLVLLGIVGIGLPLFILPGPHGQDWSLLGWIAHRGSILLFGLLLIYMFSLLVIPEPSVYYERRRQQIADLLSIGILSVLLFSRSLNSNFISYVLLALSIIIVILRLPWEGVIKGLKAKFGKPGTNLDNQK